MYLGRVEHGVGLLCLHLGGGTMTLMGDMVSVRLVSDERQFSVTDYGHSWLTERQGAVIDLEQREQRVTE